MVFLVVSLIGCESAETPSRRGDNMAPNVGRAESISDISPAARKHSESVGEAWFEDVTASSGISFTYRNGQDSGNDLVVEAVGGGVAMIDYDQDGDLDLLFAGGGKTDTKPLRISGVPCVLYRNIGDLKFVDVTEEAGLKQAHDFSFGVAVGDINSDGYPDFYLTCYQQSRLYINNRSGGFEDATETAGISFDGLNTAAVFADYDRDGQVDLFTTGYFQIEGHESKTCGNRLEGVRDVCGPLDFPPAPDRLYRNLGDVTFEDVTQKAGIKSQGKGLAVLAGDMNDDGWVDFYVTNDTLFNNLYFGGATFPLQEAALASGVAASEEGNPEGSMGVDFGDYDGDGLADLWVTNYEAEDNALYRRRSDHTFSRVTLGMGLGNGRAYVGWGTRLVDFDLDGWLDIIVTNGHGLYRTGVGKYAQQPLLYQNLEGRKFLDITENDSPYFRESHPGRGIAVGDLDNDGAPDVVITHQNQPAVLLRNLNSIGHWYRLELQAVNTERSAIGARVAIEFQGRTLMRHVTAGAGYLSHSDHHILLPAEDDRLRDVTVYWPSGAAEVFSLNRTCQTHRLIEGMGR